MVFDTQETPNLKPLPQILPQFSSWHSLPPTLPHPQRAVNGTGPLWVNLHLLESSHGTHSVCFRGAECPASLVQRNEFAVRHCCELECFLFIVQEHQAVWVDRNLFIHLSVDGCLGCFQIWTYYKQNRYGHSCSHCIDLCFSSCR